MEGTEKRRKEKEYTRRELLEKFKEFLKTGSNETQNPPDINLPPDIDLPNVLSSLLDKLKDNLNPKITRREFFLLAFTFALAACIKPSDPEEQFIIKQLKELKDYLLKMGYLEKGTENYFIDPWVFDLEPSGRATFKGTTLSQIDYQNLLKSPSKELVIVEIPQNLRPLFNLLTEDSGFLAIKVGDKVIPITWLNPQKLSEIQIPQNDLGVIELDEGSILSYIANSIKNDPRVGLRYSGQVNSLIPKAPNLTKQFGNANNIIIIEGREPPFPDPNQNNKSFLVLFYDNDNPLGSQWFPKSSFADNIIKDIKDSNKHFLLRHSIDLHFGKIPLSLQSILNNNPQLFTTLDKLVQNPSRPLRFSVGKVIFDIMIIYKRNQNNYDVLLRVITPEDKAVYYISAYRRGGFTHMYVNSAIAQRLTGLTSLESAQSISGKPLPAILRLGLTRELNSGALSNKVKNYLSKGKRLIYGFLPNIILFIVDIIKEAIQEHQLETYLSSPEYEKLLSSISQEDLKKFIEGLLTKDPGRVTLFSAIPKSNLDKSPRPFTLIINNSGRLMPINSNDFNLKISSEGLISSNVAIEANVAIEKNDEAKNASLFLQPKTYDPQNPYQVILVYKVGITPKDFLRILIGDITPIISEGQIIPVALGIIDVGDYYLITGEVLSGRVA